MKYLKGQKEKEATQWMERAAEVAAKALCLRAKCGAVIVKNEKIIGSGYNAPPRDDLKNRICLNEYRLPQKFKYDRTCCMHAEWRAMIDALKKHPKDLRESRLYFTRIDDSGKIRRSGKPYCTECSRMALDLALAQFVLWHEEGICAYPTDEYNTLSYAYGQN